jgi:prolyl-tRNA editing enzyme YbaK/EbsC (Cys-tRNA(Pro) deacylase)
MTAPLTQADVQAYIDRHALRARLIPDMGHTPTVPAAAAVLGVEPDQIIKTLLFLVGNPAAPAPVVVIANGERRVDTRRLARHFGVDANQVKLAPPKIVLEVLGYPAGGVPPFGHRTAVPIIVDTAVVQLEERFGGVIFGGGGDDRTMLELSVADLLRIHKPVIAAVSGCRRPQSS